MPACMVLFILCTTLLPVASGIAIPRQTDGIFYPWSGKNGDELRTGSSYAFVKSNITSGPTWSFHEEYPEWVVKKFNHPNVNHIYALGRAAPLIDDKENVYYTTVSSSNVYKFSRDGKQLWKFHADDGELPDIPVIHNGRLYVTTDHANTIAVDMETGKPVWNTKVGTRSAGDTWSMTATKDIIISAVTTNDGNNNRLVALHAKDGKPIWKFDTPGEIYNILVAVMDDSCVFSTSDGQVIRLRLDTGEVVWETAKPQYPSFSTGGTMIGSNGIVYSTWNEKSAGFNGEDMNWGHGVVAATNFETGKQIWKANVKYAANNAASVGRLHDGKLGVVVCLGENPDSPRPEAGILDNKGPVDKLQQIVMLDASTGATLWEYDLPPWRGSALGDMNRPDICLPDAFGNAIIAGDGTAYVGHASGLLYGLKDIDSDGHISPSELMTWQTGAAFQGTPAIADGMLAATPCDGLHVWLN